MIRVLNNDLGRALHAALHIRMMTFCNQYTPELPGDAIVQGWLNRVYNGDTNIHIIVNLNDAYTITEHAVIDVQDIGGSKAVVCHQLQHDKKDISSVDAVAEYIDKLAYDVNAYCSLLFVTKNMKAMEKRYGYSVSRTVMVKRVSPSHEDDMLLSG